MFSLICAWNNGWVNNHEAGVLRRRWAHYVVIVKLRSHMRGAVAERRRADCDFPASLPRVCWHIRGADAGGSAISWGQWWFGARGFEADAENWVLDPFLAERVLLPLRLRSATAQVWTHVMICVEANFPPASACVRPRLCERTFMSFPVHHTGVPWGVGLELCRSCHHRRH